MPAGITYNLTPMAVTPEQCDVASIYRRTGGFNLVATNLVAGSTLPPLAPLAVDFAARTAIAVKNVAVYENAAANATTIKVKKNSLAYVGMFLSNGSEAAEVTAISTANAAYDLLTISLGAAVVAGDVLFECAEPSAATAEVKGVYTLTIGTNPTAGDKITIAGKEYEFAAAPDEGKVVVGATAKATAVNLDDVLDEDVDLKATYDVSYKGATVVFKQKVGGVGAVPALVVTPVAETGTLAATIATTTPGVAAVAGGAPVPLNVCNGLNYAAVKVEAGATVTAIGAVMEIQEAKLQLPVSALDKASLGARFDFV